ncbi:MAG: hypothetical protein FJ297_08460 [Planctomycetes bacterium]|nr:hypothetical protein [Planctomycetota bacterium]
MRSTLKTRHRLALTAAAWILLAGYGASEARTAEYYVRKSGDDGNSGANAKNAWRTIDKARRAMGPGDVVYVGAGVYEETVYPRRSGDEHSPIRYVADTTGKETGDAGAVVLAPKNNWSFHLSDAAHTRIEGFTFDTPTSAINYGVYAYRSDGAVAAKCTFNAGVYFGLYLHDSDALIDESQFDGIRSHAIVVYDADVRIESSGIVRCGSYAVYNWAPATDDPSRTITLKDCAITENYGGPLVYYGKLVLDRTTIEKNTYWGAAVPYGEIEFRHQTKGITNNGYGLYIAGTAGNRKRTLRDFDLSNNGAYGLYAVNCDVVLQDCAITGMKSWAVAMVYSSLRLKNSPIRGNAHGLLVYSHKDYPDPEIRNVDIEENGGTAFYHYSHPGSNSIVHIDTMRIRKNNGWAMQSYYGSVDAKKVDVSDSAYGLYLIHDPKQGPTVTFAFRSLAVRNITNWHGLYAQYANVDLRDSEFRDSNYYGALVYYGKLRANRCVFDSLGKSSGYAVYHYNDKPISSSSPTARLTDCVFSNGYGGPYTHQTRMTLTRCTTTGHRYWGAVCNYGELNLRDQPLAINGNGYGLYVAGNGLSTARSFKGWDFSGNGNYGIYGADCNLELADCKIEKMTGWAVGLNAATLKTSNSPIQNNYRGIAVGGSGASAIAPSLTDLVVRDNQDIAVYHATNHLNPAKLTLTNCAMRNNGGWSLLSYYSDVDLRKCSVEDTPYGLYLYRDEAHTGLGKCAIEDTTIRNITKWHAVYAPASSLAMRRCRVEDVVNYGVLSYYGDCLIEDCLLQRIGTSGGYAVYHHDNNAEPKDRGTLTVRNSAVLDSYGGPYASQSNLVLDNSTIERSKYWALVSNYGDLKLVNQKHEIHNNGYGIYVAGNTSEKGRVLEGWDLSDNGAYGVYAADCDLKLIDCKLDRMTSWAACIAYGTFEAVNSPIRSSGYGLLAYSSSTAAKKTQVTGAVVENCTGYGIYHYSQPATPTTAVFTKCDVRDNGSYSMLSYYGQLDLSHSKFTGNRYGLYLYRDPKYGGAQSHTIHDVTVGPIPEWHGIYSYHGGLNLERVTVDRCRHYGVLAYYANVTAADSVLTNNSGGYAAYLYDDSKKAWDDRARLTVKDCLITGNYGGPYANGCHLTIDHCAIEKNTYWGVVCSYGDLDIRNQAKAVNNNGYGLYLAGNTPKGNRVLSGFDVSSNGSYGIYATDCDLTLEDCKVEQMTGWGAALVYGNLTLVNTPIRKNGNGLLVYSRADRGPVRVDGLESYENAGTGLYHSSHWPAPGTLTVNGASVMNNRGWGFLSYYGDVVCNGSTFSDNVYGIQVYRHPNYGGIGNHTFTDVTVRNTKSWHGLYSPWGNLRLNGCKILDNNNYGVLCYYASCVADGCAFVGNGRSSGYAIYNYESNTDQAKWPSMTLANCEITGNYGGPYGYQSRMTIDNCKIEQNKYWALICQYGDFAFQNQEKAVHNNGYGIYLAGNNSKDGRVLKGWDLSDNGAYGVYGVNCDLVLEECKLERMKSWAVGLNGSTLRTKGTTIANNAHGIYAYSRQGIPSPSLTDVQVVNTAGYALYHSSDSAAPGKLTIRNTRVENSGSYGLVNYYGELDAADFTVIGNPASSVHGLYSYRSPKFTIDRTRVVNHRNWGFLSYGNNVTARNSILGNNAYGLYLYNYTDRPTTASIVNCTLGNNTTYGVIQYNGVSTVVNNVLSSGAQGSYGLYVSGGTMNHDYNALHGYGTPFQGTGAASHEVLGHPRFTDPTANDFTLQGSSVAINRGVDLPGDVDYDILGFKRPQYGKWEIGAFEYTKPTDSAHIVKWTEVK